MNPETVVIVVMKATRTMVAVVFKGRFIVIFFFVVFNRLPLASGVCEGIRKCTIFLNLLCCMKSTITVIFSGDDTYKPLLAVEVVRGTDKKI